MRAFAAAALTVLAWPVMAQDAVPAMPEAQIYVLGEVHDNPAHHATQAAIIADVAPAALVFEMLTPQQARAATGIPRDDAAALGGALGWESSGWPDFAMYHPIFAAAPTAVLYGAALHRRDLTMARISGAAQAMGTAGRRLGLEPLSPQAQADRLAEQAAAHCDMLPENLLPGMVEVQRMRDGQLARMALAALSDTGGPVVVITGNGHARSDIGVPALIRHARPGLPVVALGQFEGTVPADAPFDVTATAPAVERGDPCDAFR